MAAEHRRPTADERHTNALLSRMPDAEYRRLEPLLHLEQLPVRQQVHHENQAIDQVYFPLTCVISIVALSAEDDPPIEVGTVGSEGAAGLPAFLGASSSPHRAFCQVEGDALRISAADLREFLTVDGALHRLLHLYTQGLIVALAQNVACNRLHNTTQRAARWLLLTHDRVHRDTFELTQQFLAQMLGVRRATVSGIASTLQDDGLIRYRRGVVTLTNRAGLEQTSCECYQIVRDEQRRLIGE